MLAGFLLCGTLSSQTLSPFCGTDLLRQQLLLEDPGFAQKQAESEVSYLEYLENHAHSAQKIQATATVPIVIHIVHAAGTPVGTAENLSDADVLAGLDLLNKAFAGVACGSDEAGNTVGIQFCLAKQDFNGNPTTGITRNASPATTVYVGGYPQTMLVTALNGQFPSTDYVNVWLVKEFCYFIVNGQCDGPAGVATLAGSHGSIFDGLIIEANVWYNPTNPCEGAKTSAHEMGHYFNLFHTFEGGCPNDNCHLQGDRVCDTAPDNDTNTGNPNCTPANSCTTDADDDIYFNPFLSDQPDGEDNYMDYSDKRCEYHFTPGQIERMNATLYGVRSSLLNSRGCQDPCIPLASASIDAPFQLMVNTPSVFTATLTNADSVAWLVDGVFATDNDTLVQVFADFGEHTVSLTVFNASGCSRTLSKTVKVYHPNCQINISIPQIPNLCTNALYELYAYPPGGQWTADGYIFSNTISASFFAPGSTNTLTYTVTDGWCRQSATVELTVTDIVLDAFLFTPIDCNNPQAVPMSLYTDADYVSWTDPLGNFGFYNGFGGMPMVSVGGTYQFTAFKGNQTCYSEADLATQNEASVSIENCTTCPAASIKLCAQGAPPNSQFKWTNHSSNVNGQQISVNQPGIWYLKVISSAGCESQAIYTISSVQNLNPVCNAGSVSDLPCFQTAHLLGAVSQGGGALEVQWLTQDGHILNGGTSLTPEIDRPGSYQLLVTNTVSGCTATDYTTVERYVAVAHTYQTICAGESYLGHTLGGDYADTVTFARSCDSVYVLHLTVLQPVVNEIEQTICAGEIFEGYSDSGTYTDVFTGQNGCDSTRVLQLTVAEVVELSTQIQADAGTGTGAIQLILLSGSGPFSYLWSTGATTDQLDNLPAGLYQLTLTDAVGCSSEFEFNVPLSVASMEPDGQAAVRLFPNPVAVGQPVGLDHPFSPASRINLLVYDLAGRLVIEKQADNAASFAFSLPVPGVFMVKIRFENGETGVFQIVVY